MEAELSGSSSFRSLGPPSVSAMWHAGKTPAINKGDKEAAIARIFVKDVGTPRNVKKNMH